MRKFLLLTAALAAFGAPAAFAQTMATPGAAAPAAVPPASQTPPEKTAPAMGADNSGASAKAMTSKPMAHAMRHPSRPMTDAEIRPGHEPGVGESFPASGTASNIIPSDTRSTIAPRLPTPAGGPNATPAMFLQDAEKALATKQSGRAQEALERAETAMLQRSVPADQASTPDSAPGVTQIRMARDALAKGDVEAARKAIAAAMSAT